MLALSYDFSVNYDNLTFTYSAQKFHAGLNSILESYKTEHLNKNLDECAGMKATAEFLTYRGFLRSNRLNHPVICNTAGITEAFDNYIEGLLDNCSFGVTYKITQIVYISE